MTVTLYEIRRRVGLVQRPSDYQPIKLWNLPMDRADFRIYAGVDNRVEFILRNPDRRPINMTGRRVKLVFINRYTQEILAQPYLSSIDDFKGLMLLKISGSTTANWPLGALAYSAIVEEPDGSSLLLFTSEDERGSAHCFVCTSPIPSMPADLAITVNLDDIDSNEVQEHRFLLERNGAPINATGYSFAMKVFHSKIDGSPTILEIDNDAFKVVEDNGDDYLEVIFGPFTGLALEVNAYYEITASKDNVHTVWYKGTIPLDPSTTFQS